MGLILLNITFFLRSPLPKLSLVMINEGGPNEHRQPTPFSQASKSPINVKLYQVMNKHLETC